MAPRDVALSSPDPTLWALERQRGRLRMDGEDLAELAQRYGTPLYVLSARTLKRRCLELTRAFAPYPARVGVHFSYKSNPVAGALQVIHACGLGAEVSSGHELWLARALGVPPEAVVFNGPNKAPEDLRSAVDWGVGLVVVDDLVELDRLEALAGEGGHVVPIALRVCPDTTPRGVGAAFGTGSRRQPFGLDLRSGEAHEAVRRAARSGRLQLRGAMAHVGSGMRDFRRFGVVAERLIELHSDMLRAGVVPDLLDVGGGLGARFSRPFTTLEMLLYLGFGRLPPPPRPMPEDAVTRYAQSVCGAVESACKRLDVPLPDLRLEPGRAVVSDAQVLLLSVGTVKQRPGLPRMALADGGAMSVSLMFLAERHAVLLANREAHGDAAPTSVFGRLPSPMDMVYRGLPLPRLEAGDVLAVMDAGAYFTPTATSFGGPRPAVVLIDDGGPRLIRRRETSDDLAAVELVLRPRPRAAERDELSAAGVRGAGA